MKSKKSSILFLLILILIVPRAFSQDISTEGTDFWVSFMGNGYYNNGSNPYLKTQVLISSLQDCSGVISNPNTNWSTPFSINANGLVFIDIPEEVAYMTCNDYRVPLDKSLHIVTDQPVSVYCANAARYSFDASYVLPTPALADNYIIQTYDQSISSGEHTSAFLIIAVDEGETTVDITPTVNTLDGKPANQSFSVTMQQGQVYQVRSHKPFWENDSRDLSGSRVAARNGKKIAVFNGNTLTMVPIDGKDSDCIFEQAMPVQAWGRQFVVTASLGRQNKDYVKITSASDGNEITVNGQHYATLNANKSKSFEMQETSCFIEASNQCAVYLYNHSKDGDSYSAIGAPSMVWIAPIEQRISELAFNTFNDLDPGHVSVDKHYVNIIVESDNVGNVILDGNPIPESQFSPVIGNSLYKFSRKEISHSAHHLSCEGGFNAHVYGFGNATGYAYMVGSKAADIAEDQFIHHPTDTISVCDSFEWHGNTYTTPKDFSDTITDGTIHNIYHYHYDLDYSPTPRISCATSGAVVFGPTHDTIAVVTNTEFFSFQYDFYVEDERGHFDDWDHPCKWNISKPSWTYLPYDEATQPNRHYCRVYVAEHYDEYVELSCTVYNHCVEDSITRTIYLKSSFLDIDEQNAVQSNFSIVPNPNNGEMDLYFEHLTGKISVKVYDMHGALVDNIETCNEMESKTIHHAWGHAPSGIYFFVATAKEGTIAKKVVIIE